MVYYICMRKDKEIAIDLRKEGKSYNDIERQLHIPKSTLSGWFSGVDWSETVKVDLNKINREFHARRLDGIVRERGQKLKLIYARAQKEAIEEFEFFKTNPLFISALMIYWGEGDKRTKHRVCVSNSEPDMLRLFSLFLEKICGVNKSRIKAWILAYPNVSKVDSLVFWSRKIGIWPSNFTKTIVIQGKSQKRTLPYGVCYVVVSSSYLKVKINVWMDLMAKNVIDFSQKSNAGII